MKSKSPTPVIKALTDVLTFGKYKGKNIRQVIEIDPDYITWMHDQKVCTVSQEIYDKAEDESVRQTFDEAMDGQLHGMRFWDIYNDD